MRKVAIALLAAAVFATGVRWGTFAAGGSDSYCYAYQAERWASLLRQGFGGPSGRLQIAEPLALEAPWPDAALTFTPAGHVPSRTVPAAFAPICPAGLSIAMAPLRLAGGRDAIFYAVPIFGALLIVATFVLGGRYGARVGVAAALLAACSPVFLYQLVQPMSDVPAAALWTAAAAAATGTKRRGPLWAGIATAGAILMRPNLVPIGIPIGMYLLWRPERAWRERIADAGVFAACAATGCVAVAAIQSAYYGSPFASGYGSLGALFSVDHVPLNARRYASWMTAVHTPLWLLAAAAPFLLPGALSIMMTAMAVVTVASYLPYTVFDDWWYLRFLLPAIPIVLVLMVAVVDAVCRRLLWFTSRGDTGGRRKKPSHLGVSMPPRFVATTAALTVVTVSLCAFMLLQARDRNAFRLRALEARFVRGGGYVAERLPANALVITSWQSGSVRFYSGRRTLVWDSLDPGWLDRAVAFASQRGLEPVVLVERWEEPLFRARFRGSAIGALDWPPAAEIAGQVRVYRPGDRDRYFRGDAAPTEYVP
jgi:hypothetical protein